MIIASGSKGKEVNAAKGAKVKKSRLTFDEKVIYLMCVPKAERIIINIFFI